MHALLKLEKVIPGEERRAERAVRRQGEVAAAVIDEIAGAVALGPPAANLLVLARALQGKRPSRARSPWPHPADVRNAKQRRTARRAA